MDHYHGYLYVIFFHLYHEHITHRFPGEIMIYLTAQLASELELQRMRVLLLAFLLASHLDVWSHEYDYSS